MGDKNTNSSQLTKALEILQDMAVNVTALDRKAAMDHLDISSASTITNYLNGYGRDLDRAIGLIEFFKERIQERADYLNDLAAA